MSSGQQAITATWTAPISAPGCWYAVQTRSYHEKVVAAQLQSCGVCTYLPLVEQIHRWSDRRKKVAMPLFPGYAFVHMEASSGNIVKVLRVPGVAHFLAVRGEPCPIPEEEINSIRTILLNNIPCVNYPFLKAGQRVRIRGGCLDGVEGILVSVCGERELVVSVDFIQQAIAMRITKYDVEVIAA